MDTNAVVQAVPSIGQAVMTIVTQLGPVALGAGATGAIVWRRQLLEIVWNVFSSKYNSDVAKRVEDLEDRVKKLESGVR